MGIHRTRQCVAILFLLANSCYSLFARTVSREVTKDDHYKGHLIPKGAQIMANNWAISRDATEYPEPETFRPERFLQPDWPREAFMPFATGSRACIGKRFALRHSRRLTECMG